MSLTFNNQGGLGSGIVSFGSGQGVSGGITPPSPGAPIVPAIAMPSATNRMGFGQSSISDSLKFDGMNTGAGAGGGFLSGIGGVEGLGTIMQGIGTLGQVWSSMQAIRMAREQLNFQKQAYETNLANQTQSYNTALEDRIRARYFTEGRGTDAVDSYLAEHSL